MSSITEHYTRYFPERLTYRPLRHDERGEGGFLLSLRLSHLPTGGRETVLRIPGILEVAVGVHTFPAANETLSGYEKSDGYEPNADRNGRSPYLEATLFLHRAGEETRAMRLGLPLLRFDAVGHDLYLLLDEVQLAFLSGGEIVNRDYLLGHPVRGEGEVFVSDGVTARIAEGGTAMPAEAASETLPRGISFYSPRGYNVFAGDVVNFSHNGVYHLLILLDRHHHGSRFGTGAHTVCHLTTSDFLHWENHGDLLPLTTQWQTFGTGTMFFFDGKYYYTHGYHTSRTVPWEKTGSPLLFRRREESGVFSAVSYEELEKEGLLPAGANYMVSEDGIHFTPARRQVHCAENPSVYPTEDGDLLMYAGYGVEGVFRAPDMDGPWREVATDLPIRHGSSPVGNSTECPSIFSFGGYTYILMGFTGFWQSGYRNREFTDLAVKGEDIYDGLCVPMVAACGDRYILSGWVGGYGWAFLLAHRELVQHEGGRLGMRWLPELTPPENPAARVFAAAEVTPEGEIPLAETASYYLTCRVHPGRNGRVALCLTGNGGGAALALDSADERVWTRTITDPSVFPEKGKALCELLPHIPEGRAGTHVGGVDFAILHVRELQGPYTLRVQLHYEEKTGNLVLDAEIGGGRTIISNRPGFRANALSFLTEGAAVTDLSLYRVENPL